LSGDSGRDDGIDEFDGLNSIRGLPRYDMMNQSSFVMQSEFGRTTHVDVFFYWECSD
jgi:hypothetical protein